MKQLPFALALAATAAFSAEPSRNVVDLAVTAASKQAPTVTWSRSSMKRIDINCDKKPDYAILGKTKDRVIVGIVVGPISEASRAHVFAFRVGAHAQDSLCRVPAELRRELLDYDPTEAVGELPGFRRSTQCSAIALADDSCDSFHFYWNHKAKRPDWWRL